MHLHKANLTNEGNNIDSSTLKDELRTCTRVVTLYPRNYYAWTYRSIVVNHLSTTDLEVELMDIEKWLRQHVSDYSAFHHRQVKMITMMLHSL